MEVCKVKWCNYNIMYIVVMIFCLVGNFISIYFVYELFKFKLFELIILIEIEGFSRKMKENTLF